MKLTQIQINKVVDSIVETKKLLNKELSYRVDLQKKEVVDEYRAHIAKLEKMLSDSWEAMEA